MMVLSATKVKSSLAKKGFISENGDHLFFHYRDRQGRKTSAWTKISHSATDIKEPLIKKMAKQTQLTKEEFVDLIKCPLTRDQYEAILKKKGIIQ